VIPFDELPRMFDPGRGYIASANQRVAPDDFAHPMYGAWAAGYRGERIDQVLGAAQPFDRQQAIALQNDVTSIRASRLSPAIVSALAEGDTVRNVLAAWDFRYTVDSAAPTVFDTFMEVWQERTVRQYVPEPLWPLVAGQTGLAARRLEADADPRDVHAAAAETLIRLQHRFGADPNGWMWGKVHQAHWRHPISGSDHSWLDIGPAPVDGGSETLRNTGAGQPAFSANGGAEYRLVVDFSEPDHILAVQNIGNSGVPGTPHYADQFQPWLDGQYHVVSLCRAEVEADLERTTVLEAFA
jgi:penicillin amidase